MTRTSIFVTQVTLAILLSLSFCLSLHAQVTVRGLITDQATELPLPGAKVQVPGVVTTSGPDGSFEFIVVTSGESVVISVAKEGYASYEKEVRLPQVGGTTVNAGNLQLTSQEKAEDVAGEDLIPTVILSDDDPSAAGAQNVSGVLTASRDVFVNAAAFVFSQGRFRLRGYDNSYTSVFLNGMPFNDLETGGVFWSEWGGLNDVTRNRVNLIGLQPVAFTFGGVAGASDIDLRASSQRKQLRVSYAASNTQFRNRLMATYSSGMMSNGWAVSASLSRRWAQEGYIDGTFFDGYSYYLSVDKQLGDHHRLSLVGLGAPTITGRATSSVQEMNDLSGSNYYNPNWGYQNGEKRNARVRDTHQPIISLRHDWKIGDYVNLTTSAGYQFGRDGDSALDWYNAADPRPDYYRKLPSYIEGPQAEQVAELLRTNEAARQINWDELYLVNRNSIVTIPNADGIAGNNVTGRRSQYVIEERRADVQRGIFSTILEAFVSERVAVHAGFNYQQQRISNFKVLEDLLGGEFYVDIDKFAEFDSTGNADFIANDINAPNRLVRQGDRFGYDFDYHIRQANAWGQLEINLPRFDIFASVQGTNTRFWRFGNVANGRFPENSAGESERTNFMDYGVKGGLTYKLDGRNYFLVNGAFLTRAPNVRDAFVSPRSRDQLVDNLVSERMTSIEGGYLLKAPAIKARAIAYYTRFENLVSNRSFYLDNAIQTTDGSRGGFVNYVMTGIATEHRGVELAAEVKLTPSLTASAVAAIGQFTYANRPNVTVFLDNVAQQLSERTVYINNYYLSGTPQSAYTVGLNYNSRRFWFVNLNVNYFDNSWVDIYPERRTTEAVSYVSDPTVSQDIVAPGSPLWNKIIDQEKLPAAMTINLFGGKSWKFNNTFLYLNIGINNLLDNQEFITGGFEQARFDFETKDVDRFPSRYFYSFGRTYFINLAVRM